MRERTCALIAAVGLAAALAGCGTRPGAYSTRWQLAWVDGRTLGIQVPGCGKPHLEVTEEPDAVTIAAIVYSNDRGDCGVPDLPHSECVHHRLKAELGDRPLVHAPRVRDGADQGPQVAPGPVPDTSPRLPPIAGSACRLG